MHMFSRNVCLEMFHDRRFLSGQIELSLVVVFVWWAKESRWILLFCCWWFCYSCYHLEHLSARVVSINITPSCRQIPPQVLTSLDIFSSSKKKTSVLKFGCWIEYIYIYITVKHRCQNQDVCVFAGPHVSEKILLQIRTAWPELIEHSPTNYVLGCFPIDAETSQRLGFHFSGKLGIPCLTFLLWKKHMFSSILKLVHPKTDVKVQWMGRWDTDRPIPLLIVVSSQWNWMTYYE